MNSTEIIEGNKLIAEFMGHDVYKDDGYIIPSNKYGISESDMMQHCFTFSVKNDGNIDKFREEHISCGGYYFVVSDFKLKYNSSWDWLMPVVEKIESLNHPVYINSNNCVIYEKVGRNHGWFIDNYADTKIEATWISCVGFIKITSKKQ